MVAPNVERDVAATCRRLLRQLRFKVYPMGDRRRALTPGMPDAYFMHAGKQLHGFIEFKRLGARQRPAQVEFEAEAKACGATYLLVDAVSVLWDWLREKGFLVES